VGGFRKACRIAFLAIVPSVAAVCIAPVAEAATISVDCATHDLQHAIDGAVAGSTLLINGTCKGNFVVDHDLVLKGNPKATLDGRSFDSVIVQQQTAHLRLVDLTITHGVAPLGGGILDDSGGRLDLLRVKVLDNVAVGDATLVLDPSGGGIFTSGALNMMHSVVAGNASFARGKNVGASGGGISSENSPFTIASSTIRDNRAVAVGVPPVNPQGTVAAGAVAGGIWASDAHGVVTDSHVDGNLVLASAPGSTYAAAGGIYVDTDSSGETASIAVVRASVSDNVVESTVVASNDPTSNPALASGGGVYGGTGGDVSTTFRSAVVNGNRVVATGDRADAEGGGVFTDPGTALLSGSSSFSFNSVEAHAGGDAATARGGGIYQPGGVTTIDRTTVDSNRLLATSFLAASADGGGVYTSGGLFVVRSTLSRNVVSGTGFFGAGSSGGGLKADSTGGLHQHLVNSTVTGNSVHGASTNGEADAFGGGVDVDHTSVASSSYSTIARNSVSATGDKPVARGGGVHITSGSASLEATILALNTAPSGRNCSGSVSTTGHNLYGPLPGCTLTPAASDKLSTAPKLGLLTNNGGPTETIALLLGSPAINAIAASACTVSVDQRGVKRPQPTGGRCDIGAFERKA
jgi:hypothetical protein